MEKEFTIDAAVEKYEQIAAYYHDGWISAEQAKLDLESLNEACEKAKIPFKADFKSLELFIPRQEDESSSSDDYGEWDAGGSSF